MTPQIQGRSPQEVQFPIPCSSDVDGKLQTSVVYPEQHAVAVLMIDTFANRQWRISPKKHSST